MINVLTPPDWKDYELLDAGDEEKLERFGQFILRRPETKAIWKKTRSSQEWEKADAKYVQNEKAGEWFLKNKLPESWRVAWRNLTFEVRTTTFKHTGVFPEMASLWSDISEKIVGAKRPINVLNLFAYTGGFTLAAAAAGAAVTHVDASKSTVRWASHNAELSGLKTKPIRWIVDDAVSFVKREVKRGAKYDAVVMDPPKFGRGTSSQIWKIEKDLPNLLSLCRDLLSENPFFFIINAYSVSFSALTLENLLSQTMNGFGGKVNCGELALKSSSSPYLLSTSIFGKWEK